MIQSLHIEKSAPGQYLARVMNEYSEALSFTARLNRWSDQGHRSDAAQSPRIPHLV